MNKFNILLIIISVLLAVTILLQQRGGGMSSAFGSSSEVYHTRRGIEKSIFIATIILSVLFIASAFARLFFN